MKNKTNQGLNEAMSYINEFQHRDKLNAFHADIKDTLNNICYCVSKVSSNKIADSYISLASFALRYNTMLYGYEEYEDFMKSREHWFISAPLTPTESLSQIIINLGEVLESPRRGFRLKPVASIFASL